MTILLLIAISFLIACVNIIDNKLEFTARNVAAHTGLVLILALLILVKWLASTTVRWARVEVETESTIGMVKEELKKNVA